MTNSKSIRAVGPTGSVRIFSSVRAAARSLSGNGTEGLKSRISRVVNNGGGYIGRTWVQAARP